MDNSRLARALPSRERVIDRANGHHGLFHDCGFCGEKNSEPMFSGPLFGICRKCAQIAQGFYLVVSRDNLSLPADYKLAWSRTLKDYALHDKET